MEKIYRVARERYLSYDLIKIFQCYKKFDYSVQVRTRYIDGDPFAVDIKSGEILRPRKSLELKKSVDASLSRSKKLMREWLNSNKFDYFVTLTFNNIFQNRNSDVAVINQFVKFRRYLRRHYPSMTYLVVPERHKNGQLHFHLVCGNITADELGLINSNHFTSSGKVVFNVTKWKYGFSTATKIVNQDKTMSYMQKYIGKTLGCTIDIKKSFWKSKNLEKPIKEFKEFCLKVKFNLKTLCSNIVSAFNGLNDFITLDYYSQDRNYICIKDTSQNCDDVDRLLKSKYKMAF